MKGERKVKVTKQQLQMFNDKIEQNSNWTFDDYARLVDSPHSELIRIEQNSVVYTREGNK